MQASFLLYPLSLTSFGSSPKGAPMAMPQSLSPPRKAVPLGKVAKPQALTEGVSREKRLQKCPQAFLKPNNKNQIPLKMPKAKRRAFPIVLLSKKAAAQTCAAAFRVIPPVQPWTLPHRLRSCRSESVPRHGRSRKRGAAGRGRAPWRESPAGWAGG